MTQAQETAAKVAVGKHLSSCPICHTKHFQLAPDVTFLPQIEGARINLGTGQPCISVSCQNCGHVMLFNAFYLGLASALGIKPAPPKTSPENSNPPTADTVKGDG